MESVMLQDLVWVRGIYLVIKTSLYKTLLILFECHLFFGTEKAINTNLDFISIPLSSLSKFKAIICFKGRGRPPTEPLPDGWIMTFHNSGIPVYLHRESRVVTWSRPYFLGTGSIRVRAANFLNT